MPRQLKKSALINCIHLLFGVGFAAIDASTFLAADNLNATLGVFSPELVSRCFRYVYTTYFLSIALFSFKNIRNTCGLKYTCISIILFLVASQIRILEDTKQYENAIISEFRNILLIAMVACVVYNKKYIMIYFFIGTLLGLELRAVSDLINVAFQGKGFQIFSNLTTTAFDGEYLFIQSGCFLILFSSSKHEYEKGHYKRSAIMFVLSLLPLLVVIGSFRRGVILFIVISFLISTVIEQLLISKSKLISVGKQIIVGLAIVSVIGVGYITFFGLENSINRAYSLSSDEAGNTYGKSNQLYLDDWQALRDITVQSKWLGVGFRSAYGIERITDSIVDETEEIVMHVGFFEIVARMGILGALLQITLFIVVPIFYLTKLRQKTQTTNWMVYLAFANITFFGFYSFMPPPYTMIKVCVMIGLSFGILERSVKQSNIGANSKKKLEPILVTSL